MSDTSVSANPSLGAPTVLGRLEFWLCLFVAIVLFSLMILRCVDVVGRYAFNMPVPGASELTALGLGLLIFGALPIVTAHSDHVTIDLLELLLGKSISRRIERVFVLATSLIALSLMAWRLWLKAGSLAAYNDGTSYLNVPLAPFAYFMCMMTALAVVVIVLQISAALRPAREI